MHTAVSVIVAHRNHNHTLPRLLDSILAQSLRELEVIIVDDCSDRSCSDIVSAYLGRGLSIRLLENAERLYTKNARLAGVAVAKAPIIAFADADDMLWGSTALEENVRMFRNSNADILHFRSVLIDEDSNFKNYFTWADPFAPTLSGGDILSAYAKSEIDGGVIWNKLYARSLWTQHLKIMQEAPIVRCEDIFLNAFISFHARAYVGSERIGYGYMHVDRREKNSMQRALGIFSILQHYMPYLTENHCSAEIVEKVSAMLKAFLCTLVGRASILAEKDPHGFPGDTAVADMLQSFDAATLIKILMFGNSTNAEKILKTVRTLYGKET